MQLTGKEINRNNRISLGVTVFSFMVLLVFLIFKNIVSAKPAYTKPQQMEVSLGSNNPAPYDFDEAKSKGLIPGKKVENVSGPKQKTVSDQNIDDLNSFTQQLLEQYKASTGKTTVLPGESAEAGIADRAGNKPESEKKQAADPRLDFSLEKRKLLNGPALTNAPGEEGKVIVEILVDKNGTVTQANPNGRGTTTSSSALKSRAKEMALATRFSPANGIEEQRGTITINFSFN